MSVLLTASKKSVKPKSAKPKKKKKSIQYASSGPAAPSTGQAAPMTPPVSSAKTAVWHWLLDGTATTVMFNKENNEVWCNGEVLDTDNGFAEDTSDGAVIDFVIYIEESDAMHQARIQRMSTGERRDGMVHQLFVDGYMILEHTGSASMPYGNGANGGDDVPPPPMYDDPDKKYN